MSTPFTGVFFATIAEAGFTEAKGFVIWKAKFAVETDDGIQNVYGSKFIVDKDGALYTKIIESLKKSLEWDGVMMADIESPAIDGYRVKVTVELQEDNPQYNEVTWINHVNDTGGGNAIEKKGATLQARLGGLLRAAAGGAPAPKPTSRPPAPAAAPAAPAPRAANKPAMTYSGAWTQFLKGVDQRFGDGYNREKAGEHWWAIIEAQFGVDSEDGLTQDNIDWLAEHAANEVDEIPM